MHFGAGALLIKPCVTIGLREIRTRKGNISEFINKQSKEINNMSDTCNVCNREITPLQKKSGFYPGGNSWLQDIGEYVAKPSHKQCNLRGLLILLAGEVK